MSIEDKLRAFAEAYPIDIFTPVTPMEREFVGNTLITKCSAEMGRHFAPFALEAADRIRELEAAINKFRGVMFCSDGRAGDALNELMALVPAQSETEVCTCDRVTQPDQHFPGCPQFNRPE